MIAVDRLAEVFVEVADTLVDDFDVIEFLDLLTRHTADVGAAASVGLLLADPHGQLQSMASSATSVKLLGLFQLQYQQGPSLDCFRTGEGVVNTDLRQAGRRWPLFAPRAVEAGFHSVHAFPLRHRHRVIGAVSLFGTDTGRLDPTDVRIIECLADVATIGLIQQRLVRNAEVITEQLQEALNNRVILEQAKGVLARTHGIGVDSAFELMRNYARSNNHRLSDVARTVVTDPTLAGLRPEGLARGGSVDQADRTGPVTPGGLFVGSATTEATWRGGRWDGVTMTVVAGAQFFPLYGATDEEGEDSTGPVPPAQRGARPRRLCPIVPGPDGRLVIEWHAEPVRP